VKLKELFKKIFMFKSKNFIYQIGCKNFNIFTNFIKIDIPKEHKIIRLKVKKKIFVYMKNFHINKSFLIFIENEISVFDL